MSIRTGDTATPFTLASAPGEPVEVCFKGRTTVLLFFPLAFSPFCTEEMCSMRDSWDGWADLDADVYGITADSPFVTDRFRQELNLPFPVLSDFNRDVARQWDVLHADLKGMKDVPKRAAFVIDPGGAVTWDWVSDDPAVLPDLNVVREAVAGGCPTV